jgi:hypothetical protein
MLRLTPLQSLVHRYQTRRLFHGLVVGDRVRR